MHNLFAFKYFAPSNKSQKIEFDINKFLYQDYSYSTHKTVPWEVKSIFGVQKINSLEKTDNDENVNASPVFCKGMDFSLSLNEDWKLSYSFLAGFYQQDLPMIFTPTSIPYLQEDWVSFNAEILLSRKIPVSKKFSFSPFAGYDYTLLTFSESNAALKPIINKKHSVIAGVEALWKPVSRVDISGGAFTSLFLNIDSIMQPEFYAGTKFNVAVSVRKVCLNIFNSMKFNFSKTLYNLDFLPSKFQPHFSNFYSIEFGLGFRVAV